MIASQTSEARRAASRHPARPFSRLPGLLARVVIALVALLSMQFTIDRDNGTIAVNDLRLCAPGTRAWSDQFADSCAYNNVTVHGDLITRTFVINMPDGTKLRTRSAEPVWVNNVVGAEHRTPATWLLVAIAIVAIFLPQVVAAAGGAVKASAPEKSARSPATLQLRVLALAVVLAGAAVYLYPSARETLAIHRVQAREGQVRADPAEDSGTFVANAPVGDFYLLGNGNFDRNLKIAGYGCRIYTADGKQITLDPNTHGVALKRSSVSADERIAGMCLFAGYDPAKGDAR